MSQAPFYDKDGKFLGSVDSRTIGAACNHRNTKDIGSCDDGCCDKYECQDCGRHFMVECPD